MAPGPVADTAEGVARESYGRLLAILAARTGDIGAAEDALADGFLMAVVDPATLDQNIAEICERLAGNAPVTMRVTKEAMRRLQMTGIPDGDDLVRMAYGSDDFHEGVEAFVAKRPAQWKGK